MTKWNPKLTQKITPVSHFPFPFSITAKCVSNQTKPNQNKPKASLPAHKCMRFKTISLKKPKASQFLSRGNPAGLLWGGKGAPLIWTTSDPRAWAVRPTPVTITATRDRSAEQFPCDWGRQWRQRCRALRSAPRGASPSRLVHQLLQLGPRAGGHRNRATQTEVGWSPQTTQYWTPPPKQ